MARAKLCLGNPEHEYVQIGEGFTFPDNNDNPVVNSPSVPASFWWDPGAWGVSPNLCSGHPTCVVE